MRRQKKKKKRERQTADGGRERAREACFCPLARHSHKNTCEQRAASSRSKQVSKTGRTKKKEPQAKPPDAKRALSRSLTLGKKNDRNTAFLRVCLFLQRRPALLFTESAGTPHTPSHTHHSFLCPPARCPAEKRKKKQKKPTRASDGECVRSRPRPQQKPFLAREIFDLTRTPRLPPSLFDTQHPQPPTPPPQKPPDQKKP